MGLDWVLLCNLLLQINKNFRDGKKLEYDIKGNFLNAPARLPYELILKREQLKK